MKQNHIDIIKAIRAGDINNIEEGFDFAKTLIPGLSKKEFEDIFNNFSLADFGLVSQTSANTLNNLRKELTHNNNDAYIISTNDDYLNEYPPLYARRLFYLTGFSGSYGFAVVTKKTAALFVDGRYTEQAKKEVDQSLITIEDLSNKNIISYLNKNLATKAKVAFSSKSISLDLANYFIKALAEINLLPVLIHINLIDNIWNNQPPKPLSYIFLYPEAYAGESTALKIKKILAYMQKHQVNSLLISALDDIAWLLNIRGNDIACNPFVLSTALIKQNGHIELWIDPNKITKETKEYFNNNNINIHDETTLEDNLLHLTNQTIGIFKDSSVFYKEILQTNNTVKILPENIIKNLKCVKNSVEQKNSINAHVKDGAALTKLIIWLNRHLLNNHTILETELEKKILQFKQQIPAFKSLSFETIVAANSNAAFPHYHATLSSNAIINKDSLLLIDCGTQFLEGTTDVTRTLSFSNNPPTEFKTDFTLVLKGLIALSRAEVPKGTTGGNLDALARQFLWQYGINYNHGTGHGVGQYLGVHEEPIRFSPANNYPLEPGMIISVEPGCYKVNKWGIRIENLVLVINSDKYKDFLTFLPLTMVPIDTKNINKQLLTSEEIKWLNDYHVDVNAALATYLTKEELADLNKMTAPI